MVKGNVFSGPRAKFKINNITVGYATNVEIGESIEQTPVEVLDNMEVSEFVAVGYRVTLSCGTIKIVGNSLQQQGLFPATGKDFETHLLNCLNADDLTATLEDVKTGKAIAMLSGVKIVGHNYRISARAIVGEDVSFVAIRMFSEGEIP